MASGAQVGVTINGRKVSLPTLQHDKILTMHEWQLRRAAPQHWKAWSMAAHRTGSSNAHSTTAPSNFRYPLCMWRTLALFVHVRHQMHSASPENPPRLLSGSSADNRSGFQRHQPPMLLDARAFGVSRKAFGPCCSTLRTKTSGSVQLSNNHRRNFSALSISAETTAALARRDASDK
jgi:hypothetical protein